MILFRATLLLAILFAAGFGVLWLATSTDYFNAARIKRILKNAALFIGAVIFAIFAFAVIVNTQSLF